MIISRALHLGMCFGVRDAIALAQRRARVAPLTILGDLVHNETVLAELKQQGIQIVQQAAAAKTAQVMVTAHGASEKAVGQARALGLEISEATCPLVKLAHGALKRLVSEGCYPVIVGKRGHVEVRGMTEDLADFDVVLTDADVFELAERSRFGVVAQTTQPVERVRHLVGLLRWRFPNSEVRFVDTVCQPTKQRQHAAVELARDSDVVIVIGGSNSNNTQELVRSCAHECRRVHHVQTADDLRDEWFQPDDRVGITAGTSTPDALVDDVEHWLRARFPLEAPAGCAQAAA